MPGATNTIEAPRSNLQIRIGTAGWAIPRAFAHALPAPGTHLARYARAFNAVEINSSFYRPHLHATYERWAASTPSEFRFSVKVPRVITHEQALRRSRPSLRRFLDETAGLGLKRGPLLVQLPPSLAFDRRVAARFFDALRSCYDGPVACEPRHATWFSSEAERLLIGQHVGRVGADPPRAPGGDLPGGWPGLVYWRLHGSPRVYWSRYDAAYILAVAEQLRAAGPTTNAWCIFDNTAAGAAFENARDIVAQLALARASAISAGLARS